MLHQQLLNANCTISLKKELFFHCRIIIMRCYRYCLKSSGFFFLRAERVEIGQYLCNQNNNFTNIILVRNPSVLESESLDFNCVSITSQLRALGKSVSTCVSVNEEQQ